MIFSLIMPISKKNQIILLLIAIVCFCIAGGFSFGIYLTQNDRMYLILGILFLILIISNITVTIVRFKKK